MSQFEFSNIGPGLNGVRAICDQCEAYLLRYAGNRVVAPEEVLLRAEEIASQMLRMYPYFQGLSMDFKTHTSMGNRIPAAVRRTLMFATVREHEDFGQLIAAMCSAFQSDSNSLIEDAAEIRHDFRFTSISKPTLWDEAGLLKYDPAPFALFHEPIFRSEVNHLFKAGAPGIEKILADYSLMSRESQGFMDQKLLERACSYRVAEDDPIRWALRQKITPAVDAVHRLEQVFDTSFCLEEGSMFTAALDHFCKLLPRLSDTHIGLVLQGVENLVDDWVGGDRHNLVLPDVDDPRGCLRLFMEKMRPYGLDLPDIVQKKMGLDRSDRFFVEELLKGTSSVEDSGWSTSSIWMAAALDEVGDERLIAAGLDAEDLDFLCQERGSKCLREALLKTSKGRDMVFSGDLGL